MSKYNLEYHHNWYLKNRERLLGVRKKYNKKYRENPENIEKDKIRNAKPERKAYRKRYKKTVAGKLSNKKYIAKESTKLRIKNNHLVSLYGITLEEYNNLVIKQDSRCLICGNITRLHIDHSHSTGKIRGLLCGKCNRGLGMFGDKIKLLKKAIKYLNK